MTEVRPTIVLSVPRLYEKMYARVLENALAGCAVKKRIFFWASATARTWADVKLARREPVPGGCSRSRSASPTSWCSRSCRRAPADGCATSCRAARRSRAEIDKFFYAAGLVILEGYGLTETSPVIAVNTSDNFRIGTVGKPIPGVEVKIARDGEILTRGPHVMKGYYNKPDATARGDRRRGLVPHRRHRRARREGFLAITDRKKDIIVTAGGKNIAPQPIENPVKTNKYVSQGRDDRRQAQVPHHARRAELGQPEEVGRAEEPRLRRSTRACSRCPRVAGEDGAEDAEEAARTWRTSRCRRRSCCSSTTSRSKAGELTPTLKVKRRVVEQNYKSQIEALYSESVGGSHDV